MTGRSTWLFSGLVAAIHLILLGSFSEAGSGATLSAGKSVRSTVQVIYQLAAAANLQIGNAPAPTEQAAVQQPMQHNNGTHSKKTPSPVATDASSEMREAKPGSDAVLAFKPEIFLDLQALDEAARTSSAFESVLASALPARFEHIVLEFFIDETGRIVKVFCVEGDCSADLPDKLMPQLAVPFTPALKDGQTVASRKVIEVLPLLTLGL